MKKEKEIYPYTYGARHRQAVGAIVIFWLKDIAILLKMIVKKLIA
jgi:hypothetical protein